MIVPKPQKEFNGICDAWRVNFYHFEIDILRDFGNIKPAIKLMKVISSFFYYSSIESKFQMQQLRDSLTMKSLFSYAIKTTAMWMKESGELSRKDEIEMAFLKVCFIISTNSLEDVF
jgi:Mab-21 protein